MIDCEWKAARLESWVSRQRKKMFLTEGKTSRESDELTQDGSPSFLLQVRGASSCYWLSFRSRFSLLSWQETCYQSVASWFTSSGAGLLLSRSKERACSTHLASQAPQPIHKLVSTVATSPCAGHKQQKQNPRTTSTGALTGNMSIQDRRDYAES